MVFHVLSIPVYPTRKEITLCAFTQKVYKFCQEMTKRGHTVYHYGHPNSKVNCTEHINVISEELYNQTYQNKKWQDFLPQNVNNELHKQFNDNAYNEILKRNKNNKEFLLAFWGFGHADVAQRLDGRLIVVEPSIGYDSLFAKHRVFESYAQLHKILGAAKMHPSQTDHVIPPGFYEADFEFKTKKENYLLFLGRIVDSKGVLIADQMARLSNMPIKFVGPQTLETSLVKNNPKAEYIHTVSYEERKHLLANAKALLMPSLYIEPCGWSMIEAWFSGTPVITTDWGGPAEYNIHMKTGFRCRSLNEFFHAINLTNTIDPHYCMQYACRNFNISHIMSRYESYFEFLLDDYANTIKPTCKFTVSRGS